MQILPRFVRDLGGLLVVIGLLLLLTFLPPDTSLSEVQASGALRACVPTVYPPLVTGDDQRPGIDIELLGAVADRIGVELLLSPSDAIGQDFNPRNWAINRGKCQILAGGVVDSTLTRSFLDTSPPYARTGWAIMAPASLDDIGGLTIGVLTNISGLDRLGLSSYLRRLDVTVRIMRDSRQLVDAIAGGELDGGVTEALLARAIASDNGWWVTDMPEELTRYNLVFGLWKGDLTLKRRIVEIMEQLEADGTLAAILARYGALPLGRDGSPPPR
ncbi:substrate-binding periplasmic protein [Devosia limi]|uniref:Cystine transport system substrate-binding protein n=1 Tax=Devosia limi DSM 17137 TaxID=1121477 RepID=A0A1M5ADP5_9HYPH|nr:transporter substrate-binding domain-containing protein [Devosia limi]SHF28237.1 cystine transport system substrate-binding protein [Devosia limi DSM 17137]